MGYLTHLECPRCGAEHDADRPQNLCECGSPLLARYDLGAVGRAVDPGTLASRPADLWRYRELLPVRDDGAVTTLRAGWTPMLPGPPYAERIGRSEERRVGEECRSPRS